MGALFWCKWIHNGTVSHLCLLLFTCFIMFNNTFNCVARFHKSSSIIRKDIVIEWNLALSAGAQDIGHLRWTMSSFSHVQVDQLKSFMVFRMEFPPGSEGPQLLLCPMNVRPSPTPVRCREHGTEAQGKPPIWEGVPVLRC